MTTKSHAEKTYNVFVYEKGSCIPMIVEASPEGANVLFTDVGRFRIGKP